MSSILLVGTLLSLKVYFLSTTLFQYKVNKKLKIHSFTRSRLRTWEFNLAPIIGTLCKANQSTIYFFQHLMCIIRNLCLLTILPGSYDLNKISKSAYFLMFIFAMFIKKIIYRFIRNFLPAFYEYEQMKRLHELKESKIRHHAKS